MLINIDKIIVKDRIRKDFGDIQELADDIRQNGLINPPVVNKEYELLAGERRLKACKALGWNQIEVRMMDTRDAEHELEVEISENESRKDFSKAEREEMYTRRVMFHMSSPIGLNSNDAEREAAKEVGSSRTTMQREKYIVDNKDFLSSEDFADWDEGKLSTNKAFQKIKSELDKQKAENERLRDDNRTLAKRSEPQVIEKEVIKEVVPADYDDLKRKADEAETYKRLHQSMTDKWRASEAELDSLKKQINDPIEKRELDLKQECIFFCTGIRNFIERYGGYAYLKSEIDNLPKRERDGYLTAVKELQIWADTLLGEISIGG